MKEGPNANEAGKKCQLSTMLRGPLRRKKKIHTHTYYKLRDGVFYVHTKLGITIQFSIKNTGINYREETNF